MLHGPDGSNFDWQHRMITNPRTSAAAPQQHAAILYYFILTGLFFVSPQLAYNFSELIEAHAVDTYGARLGRLGHGGGESAPG